MAQNVILIFDIGKTNKKILLFDQSNKVVLEEESKFQEITDEEGYSCDDIEKIEVWMINTIKELLHDNKYKVTAVNITTYGASLMHLDETGKRLTPVYNYLKPMPEDVLAGFYEKYGGIDEFSRATASPALGMLNSGLQALWLKKKKGDLFRKVKNIMHFPQYLSYIITGKITSEYTSIGCHTAMWNFDKMTYHQWLKDENIPLPEPVSNSQTYDVKVDDKSIKAGIGIHDSSASLVPYLKSSKQQFILVSTGTWCIFMNPFNNEPLTAEQLKKDTLCYMSVQQKQVKSSRLFMGHIHDVNVKVLSEHFHVAQDQYKKVKPDLALIKSMTEKNKDSRCFFRNGVPADYIDKSVDLKTFKTFDEAYHQLMIDLTSLGMESMKLIIAKDDQVAEIYISGGFAKNEIFVKLLASYFPGKKVYTSEVENSTALGAALIIWDEAFNTPIPEIDLGLKEIKAFDL